MTAKNQQKIIVSLLFFSLFFLLFITRFYNLSWGLPYPFHPDERNMASALINLSCSNASDCLKPDFFAYGQTTLYLAFLLKQVLSAFFDVSEWFFAFLSLRIISALASVVVVFVVVKIFGLIYQKKGLVELFYLYLLLIFSPVLIQFSHFGTTEAVLSLLFSLLVYFSCLLLDNKINLKKYIYFSAICLGVASAVKLSSVLFVFVVLLTFLLVIWQKRADANLILFHLVYFSALSLFFYFLASPYNLFEFQKFLGSMHYESSVALGSLKVFYTQQFEGSIPVVFQLLVIFPYALGILAPIFFALSYLRLFQQKNLKLVLLKLSVLFVFLVNSFLFTKWTRFLAPVYPLVVLLIYLELIKVKCRKLFLLVVWLFIVQGLLFFGVYLKEDIRLSASKWLSENIPAGSVVVQESGNVVDLPLFPYKNQPVESIGLNLYDFDNSAFLSETIFSALEKADYVIVPSRRVFANYSCYYPNSGRNIFYNLAYLMHRTVVFNRYCSELKNTYPVINKYYQSLLESGQFELVAEFSAFKDPFFNKTLFYDELAEETFSVFDHPVIRIYKRKS
ncbi:MAG: hypothetical protein KatS3mg091_050 [Patescibacteria group bacterium]|nr:MAG: hypothetical protein KatS3mg091_050 [Patescibacteria group bacterium]